MRCYTMLAAAILFAVCSGCQSYPGGSPRCPGGQFGSGPVDTDGNGSPDAFGVWWEWLFVVACTIPGEDVGVALSTEISGGVRIYRLNVFDGPATGETFKIVDVYDAISAMDQVFKLSGYDMTYTETSNYRDSVKTWLIDNWIPASDFYANTGY